jgi:hypothetical protein
MLFRSLSNLNQSTFFLVFVIAVVLFSLDTTIGAVSDFLVKQTTSFAGIAFFVGISIVFFVVSFVLLRFIKNATRGLLTGSTRLKILQGAAFAAQILLMGVLVALLVQIIFFSQYYTILLVIANTISGTLAAVIMVISALILLEWYRFNMGSYLLLIFGVAFAITAYTFFYSVISDGYNLIQKNQIITPKSEVTFASETFEPGSIRKVLSDIYQYSATVSFAMFVAGSAILLRHYSAKVGRVKFWILVLLPLVYYISTLVDVLGIYIPESDTERFNYFVYGSFNGIIGGILLGVLFWSISRTMRPNKSVANYLLLCAYGFILNSIASSSAISAASYPPFGYVSLSMLTVSSYMIILGLYSTAISISQDVRLRKYIKELTRSDTGFLSTIGEAQIEKHVQAKALDLENVVKEERMELEKKTGIESSIQEQDIKGYLLEVLQEVDKYKSGK